MVESNVERRFKREVERAGGEVRKLVTPGRRHAPDRLVIWPRLIAPAVIDFVEMKRPGGKLRAGQKREIDRLVLAGCNVFVLDSHAAVDEYLDWRVAK